MKYESGNIVEWFKNCRCQMSSDVIRELLSEFGEEALKRSDAIVFGLGNDSTGWNELFSKTIFVEDDMVWYSDPRFVYLNKIFYAYDHKISDYYKNGKIDHDALSVIIKRFVSDFCPFKDFPTIVVVDGPKGYNEDCAGRLCSILWSAASSAKILVVDDIDRQLEKHLCGMLDAFGFKEHARIGSDINSSITGIYKR